MDFVSWATFGIKERVYDKVFSEEGLVTRGRPIWVLLRPNADF